MPELAARVQTARITVTVKKPEWGGAVTIHAHQWRLAEWNDLLPDEVRQVVYIPGAFANFARHAPRMLLRAGVKQGQPLVVTALDLPEYQASRLPPDWAGRLARAGTLVDDTRLLLAVLDRV